MWLVFGAKSRSKRVAGGREVERPCTKCERATRWVECEVKDDYKAFFVKVASTTVRRMVCVECGEDADLDEMLEMPATPAPAARSKTEPAPRRAPTEAEKDAMLKALKKKMQREGK